MTHEMYVLILKLVFRQLKENFNKLKDKPEWLTEEMIDSLISKPKWIDKDFEEAKRVIESATKLVLDVELRPISLRAERDLKIKI